MIPDRLLRSLTLRTASIVTASDGSNGKTYTTSTILGRIDQQSGRENIQGREASITEWRLFTNTSVPDTGQIVDGSTTYDITASWAEFRDSGVHHYEAILRRVTG